MSRLLVHLSSVDNDGKPNAAVPTSFFVDVIQGEIRIRSAAVWDALAGKYVEAKFDVVHQTVVKP